MPEGSHRMRKDWIEDRMTWLNEEGMPKPISKEDWDKNFGEEQTYLATETQERELNTWRALLQDGELTQSQVDKIRPNLGSKPKSRSLEITLRYIRISWS